MGHPSLKKRSKRMSCRKRYKIEKKVKEHNRKKRKEAKKHPKGPKPSLIVAPNLCPFKEDAIREFSDARREEKEIILQNLKESSEKADSLEGLVNSANERNDEYDTFKAKNDEGDEVLARLEKLESTKLAKEFKKVIAEADIILEVVDARDPLGTRCKIVEETVLKHPGKRLVIVVNKADLVPRDILERWLTYLRGQWPAVPFKASIQQQKKLGRRAMIKKSKKKKVLEKLMAVSSCVGAELLMKLLANYRRNKGIATSITVGVVGMPNVGKSSVINSLKRSKSCRVGAKPGVTRNMQTVQIGANIKILDSPGIVTQAPEFENKSLLALKNVLSTERLQDPMAAANAILRRATKKQMMSLYNVEEYVDTQNFLFLLAKRYCLLGKRGIPDTFKAARMLVTDWNRGRIRYYTVPPEDPKAHVSAEIVSEASQEFDINMFKEDETVLMSVIDDIRDDQVLYLTDGKGKQELQAMDMDSKQPENNVVIDETIPTKKRGKLRWRKKKDKAKSDILTTPLGVSKLKKKQKLEAKKKRKEDARKKRKDINFGDKSTVSMDVDQ